MFRTQDIAASRPAIRASVPQMIPGTLCSVTLIDRRTGAAHRVGGRKLTVFTRNPVLAVDELMTGRDPSAWDVQVLPLDLARRR